MLALILVVNLGSTHYDSVMSRSGDDLFGPTDMKVTKSDCPQQRQHLKVRFTVLLFSFSAIRLLFCPRQTRFLVHDFEGYLLFFLFSSRSTLSNLFSHLPLRRVSRSHISSISRTPSTPSPESVKTTTWFEQSRRCHVWDQERRHLHPEMTKPP